MSLLQLLFVSSFCCTEEGYVGSYCYTEEGKQKRIKFDFWWNIVVMFNHSPLLRS